MAGWGFRRRRTKDVVADETRDPAEKTPDEAAEVSDPAASTGAEPVVAAERVDEVVGLDQRTDDEEGADVFHVKHLSDGAAGEPSGTAETVEQENDSGSRDVEISSEADIAEETFHVKHSDEQATDAGEAAALAEGFPEDSSPSGSSASSPSIEPEEDSTPLAKELEEMTKRRRVLTAPPLPLPDTTRVITVSNQKGGVGKTTTTVNLAAGLARAGANVLVVDLDPQGNASTGLSIDHRSEVLSVYDVIVNDVPLGEVIQKSPEFERLYCVPATIHLAGAEIELVSLVAREQRLRRALDAHMATMDRPFDYVFIDCPPSLGLLTINAFVAAREVLIPIQCEYYALEGLSQLLKNIDLIEKHLNPDLHVSTILLTMFDSRTNLANQVAQEVREHFPKQTLETLIPRSVRISEAPSYGQSVISYDTNSSGSLSYLEAAAEIAQRHAAAAADRVEQQQSEKEGASV